MLDTERESALLFLGTHRSNGPTFQKTFKQCKATFTKNLVKNHLKIEVNKYEGEKEMLDYFLSASARLE